MKARCAAFRARHLLEPLPVVEKPVDGRLGDIMQPLALVAEIIGGDLPDLFPAIVESFRTARQAARAESNEAHLVAAVQAAIEEGGLVGDVIPTGKVLEVYNATMPDQYKLSERQIGHRLLSLGFQSARVRDSTGAKVRGRVVDDTQLAQLRQKFGLLDVAEKSAGHETAQTGQTAQPDTRQARADVGPLGPTEGAVWGRGQQNGPRNGPSHATASGPLGPLGPFDVQTPETENPEKTCTCPVPEHYAEGEPHPPGCPVCRNQLWCWACRGCIPCGREANQ